MGASEATSRIRLPVNPEEVWDAWVDPENWNKIHDTVNTTIDLRVGGLLITGPDYEAGQGEAFVFQEIDAPRRLVFAWVGQEEGPVALQLTPEEGGTEVVITERGIADAEWAEHQTHAWTWVLESLEHWFRTGTGIPVGEWWEANVGSN